MASFTSTRSAGALVLCLSLLASACASDPEISTQASATSAAPSTSEAVTDTSDSTEPGAAEQAPADEAQEPAEPVPAVAFDLPSVELTNVATGDAVDLATVADGKPLVLWFWAPH